MKKYLAVYMGSPSGPAAAKWDALEEAAREELQEEGQGAWMSWVMAHQKSIVEVGSPLGKTLKVSADGISGAKNEIVAYTIVQADSHEDAAKLFIDHPHFTIFPGDSVEILECLPIPGM